MPDQTARETPATDAFEQLVALLDYPMYVVTTRADEESAGCLVGFTSQVSISPRRFLVGLSKRNHTYRVARGSDHLAVHLLPRRHRDLARLFGSQTGDHVDKFARCSWRAGPHGMPILTDAIGWFVGDVLSRIDVGDHVAFLLEPVAGSAPQEFEQLVTFAMSGISIPAMRRDRQPAQPPHQPPRHRAGLPRWASAG